MTRTASGGCGRLTHGGGLALLLEIVYSKLENRPKFSWKTEKRLQRHPPAGGVVKYRVDSVKCTKPKFKNKLVKIVFQWVLKSCEDKQMIQNQKGFDLPPNITAMSHFTFYPLLLGLKIHPLVIGTKIHLLLLRQKIHPLLLGPKIHPLLLGLKITPYYWD